MPVSATFFFARIKKWPILATTRTPKLLCQLPLYFLILVKSLIIEVWNNVREPFNLLIKLQDGVGEKFTTNQSRFLVLRTRQYRLLFSPAG